MTYFSSDVFASIANLADKRARKQHKCCDCGALISAVNAKRCGPCVYERSLERHRLYSQRQRDKRKASQTA